MKKNNRIVKWLGALAFSAMLVMWGVEFWRSCDDFVEFSLNGRLTFSR